MPKSTPITMETANMMLARIEPEQVVGNTCPQPKRNGGTFDAEAFIHKHLEVKSVSTSGSRTKYVLAACPFDDSHRAPDAAAFIDADGKLGFKCLHASCSQYGWKDVRQKFEPNAYDRQTVRFDTPHNNGGRESLPDTRPENQAERASGVRCSWEDFPIDALPAGVREYVDSCSKAIGCNIALVAASLLTAAAGAIGNTYRLQMKRGYSEPAVLWMSVIAESGSKKSPAIEAPFKAIQRRELEEHRKYAEAVREHGIQIASYQVALQDWKKNGSKEGQPLPQEPEQPIAKRFTTTDITLEALCTLMEENPRGLVSYRDELSGFIASMDQYRGGRGGDEAHYLAMHGARQLRVDRKTAGKRTTLIPFAALSIIGGIQPGILKHQMGRDKFESGMMARFLLCYPPPQVSLWTEDEVPEAIEDNIFHMFHKLLRLDFNVDEQGENVPHFLPMESVAKQEWVTFHNEQAHEQVELSDDLSAAWSKLTGYSVRLALVLQLMKWAIGNEFEQPHSVDLDSVKGGITLAKWFSNETKRVYGLFGQTEDDHDCQRLVNYISKKGGSITPRELQRGMSHIIKTTEDAEKALQAIVRDGLGRFQTITPANGGHAVLEFILNH